ncbi:MAG: Gx transporter family protein [Treponema sp.]|nr:Gx transporter family protein [Treponema sp.]
MELQNKKDKIAFLASLSLIYSYIEFLLPRPVPFLRLGFSNAIILSALFLDFPSFFILCIIKAVCSSFISGILFSPFFIISFSQSVSAGLIMYGAKKLKIFSVYGISLLGAACSAVVQIYLCSLYLGKGTINLLWIMLSFSVFSGIITAWLSQKIELPESFDFAENTSGAIETGSSRQKKISSILRIFFILIFSCMIFATGNIFLLILLLILSFIIQLISRRRFIIMPHIFMWLFVFLSSIFVPAGKIIFSFWKITITDGAINSALMKALKLSSSMMLSQAASTINFEGNSIIAKTLKNYSRIINKLNLKNRKWNFSELLNCLTQFKSNSI